MPNTIEFRPKPPPGDAGPRYDRAVEKRIEDLAVPLSFSARWNLLTDREKEIAKLLVFHDMEVKEVMAELHLSKTAVTNHTMVILRVMACRNVKRLALLMGVNIRAIVPEFKEEG